MKIASIQARVFDISTLAHVREASSAHDAASALWVEAIDQHGRMGCGEAHPRASVAGETLGAALAFVTAHASILAREIVNTDSLAAWVEAHRAQIDLNPAAWAAVETALLDLIGQSEGRTVDELLGLPPLSGRYRYSASIGNGPPERFHAALARCLGLGFRDYRIELSGDTGCDGAKIAALRAAGSAVKHVYASANNVWRNVDEAVEAIDRLDFPFIALEEPLQSDDYTGMARIGTALGTAIVVDRSVLRWDQLAALQDRSVRWIVKVGVSKMGGVLRSLAVSRAVRDANLCMVIGADVGQSSLLTRAALTVAGASRDILLGQEAPSGTAALEHDAPEPPIAFGADGVLDAAGLPDGPGWGTTTWRAPQ